MAKKNYGAVFEVYLFNWVLLTEKLLPSLLHLLATRGHLRSEPDWWTDPAGQNNMPGQLLNSEKLVGCLHNAEGRKCGQKQNLADEGA